jgi:hypothetical protein
MWQARFYMRIAKSLHIKQFNSTCKSFHSLWPWLYLRVAPKFICWDLHWNNIWKGHFWKQLRPWRWSPLNGTSVLKKEADIVHSPFFLSYFLSLPYFTRQWICWHLISEFQSPEMWKTNILLFKSTIYSVCYSSLSYLKTSPVTYVNVSKSTAADKLTSIQGKTSHV